MLNIRNLSIFRAVYIALLEAVARSVHGPRAPRPEPLPAEKKRLSRINSELAFNESQWERHFERTIPKQSIPQTLVADVGACLNDGIQGVVGDLLSACFTSSPIDPWNFLTRTAPPDGIHIWLVPVWLLSVWVRYCVLVPIRLLILVLGFIPFLFLFPIVNISMRKSRLRTTVQQYLLRYLASVFVASWSGFVRYHGTRPTRQPNQIYVANHSGLIDVFLLFKDYPFSAIGQRHGGIAGALQDLLLSVQNHVWFDREEGKDRQTVQALLKRHVADPENEPMLVFPEGTCVNNEYCIMFKRGSFELGATVYPVAIKYKKEFADCYWNSSKRTFGQHLVDVMTSWAVFADIYYLPPMKMGPEETSTEFSSRVKLAICEKAGLINVNWNGFLKRHPLSSKYVEQRQKSLANVLKKKLMVSKSISVPSFAAFLDGSSLSSGDAEKSAANGEGLRKRAVATAKPLSSKPPKHSASVMNLETMVNDDDIVEEAMARRDSRSAAAAAASAETPSKAYSSRES
mmetsp:Transcript_5186/g.13430  ORF Transcript_5186/g.13430 Transcript_5186/m.13430 type:complete len:515 (-) Transcript_5186:208-1752(-)